MTHGMTRRRRQEDAAVERMRANAHGIFVALKMLRRVTAPYLAQHQNDPLVATATLAADRQLDKVEHG